jgi:hypothetical protein
MAMLINSLYFLLNFVKRIIISIEMIINLNLNYNTFIIESKPIEYRRTFFIKNFG